MIYDIGSSRFRRQHRSLTPEETALREAIIDRAEDLESLIDRARDLRFPLVSPPFPTPGEPVEATIMVSDPGIEYFAEAMKCLELAVMWTVKGLTS